MSEMTWPPEGVSGREREILDIIYQRGAATAAEVQTELKDAPVYGAVRTMLSRLEAKGHICHRQEGARYVYEPTVTPPRARQLAFDWLVRTFFSGSALDVAAAALDRAAVEMPEKELADLAELVQRVKSAEVRTRINGEEAEGDI